MDYGLYVITDEGISHGLSHVEIARKVAEGGADVIQLRDKARTEKDMLSIALQIGEITRSSDITFIINDRLDLALASGADGVRRCRWGASGTGGPAHPICPQGRAQRVHHRNFSEVRSGGNHSRVRRSGLHRPKPDL